MCGINGIIRLHNQREPVNREELLRTRDYMFMRGPDAAGEWISSTGEIGLAHRRLAIIDLSSAGLQPMSFDAGRYQIVFNGEIYNYRELRQELERDGVSFHSQSDTEVLLALYMRDKHAMLSKLRGMYAFGIWDQVEHSLFLVRDPYGIKPLYYTIENHFFRFASQVKALQAGGGINGDIEPAGVVGFLLWGSVPEPYTLYRSIRALPAGHYLMIRAGRVQQPVPYYRFEEVMTPEHPQSSIQAIEHSVKAHLVADVPVAIFLSAGLDSSLLAAIACRYVSPSLTTITLRFDSLINTPFDEAPLAKKVAESLGTHHIEFHMTREEFLHLWPYALTAMDQPSIDGFNTYVISKIAHDAGLKVVLSGLGGDELFGSYASFKDVPQWLRVGKFLNCIPGLGKVWPTLAQQLRPQQPKLAGFLRYGTTLPGSYFLHRGLFLPQEISTILDRSFVQGGLTTYYPVMDSGTLNIAGVDAWTAIHIMESIQYLRNQLLRDADWASMAHSLELRVPFVDVWLRTVLADANFEPVRSQGKAAIVKQIAPELPDTLWDRPKSGFSIPVVEWLQNRPNKAHSHHWGKDSRTLALMVLKEFLPSEKILSVYS
jgi:asparagine synthase (glutamine-hydrolysing)